MSRVLIISGHPDLKSSNTNKLILQNLVQRYPEAEVRELDSLYPDGKIDVQAEQQSLLGADVLVLQFPFYWYSVPGLMKTWIDEVFSYNFAYGRNGDKLKGKHLLLSLTIGGPKDAYQPLGYNHFSVEQLLFPLQQTAYLTGMVYQQPIYSHGMVYIEGVYNSLQEVSERAMEHTERLDVAIRKLVSEPVTAG
ncbi:NAD(P)H-dependent oxidoreductase [Dongshaea marina]|uniref:NAD(P)H-dependent oxidoreductase n=1 Tax=Dongshaea marina TaxID=2047966 RepID=UPI000D3E7224|nr:NAD(P)H-dependent oxidoreductase [Dongshaea marina]